MLFVLVVVWIFSGSGVDDGWKVLCWLNERIEVPWLNQIMEISTVL